MSVRTRFSSHLFWVFLQFCFLPLSTELLFLMVLFLELGLAAFFFFLFFFGCFFSGSFLVLLLSGSIGIGTL